MWFCRHKYTIARHINPVETRTKPLITRSWSGELVSVPSVVCGFMSYGIETKCDKCGKVIDASGMDLPILQPDFSNKKVTK